MIRYILVLLLVAGGTFAYIQYKNKSTVYDSQIKSASERHQVPFSLIKAVIRKESSFIASQKGDAGEFGLMQIMPIAADEWSRLTNRPKIKNYSVLMDPSINIDIGTYLLSVNLKRWEKYEDATALALAEYNAGLGNLRKNNWAPENYDEKIIERITFPMTKNYVRDILEYRTQYLEHDK